MTTQDILIHFDRFDKVTLEKLLVIGDSILTPMDTELTSVDFATMVNSVFSDGGLADKHFPEWKDRSKSDFGRFLVELFAVFSDKDFFYVNHYSREGFLKVADLYRSIFHKALHQGFNPPSNISATGVVELTFAQGAAQKVTRGAIILGVSSIPDLVYINEAFILPESTLEHTINVDFMHGKLRKEQQFFDGYSIVVAVSKIVTGSIELVINGDVWTETDNFVGNSGKKFMVFYSEEGKAEIYFAQRSLEPQIIELALPLIVPVEGSVCDIEYVVGGGYLGDIDQDTVDVIIGSQTTRNLLSYQQFAITGGNDLMGKELLRETVIGKQRHQNRIVTPDDAAYFCKEVSFVHKVYTKVYLNYCYIYILPIGGGDISPSQKSVVMQKVLPYLILGWQTTISSPIYVPITLRLNIYVLPSTRRATAQSTAEYVVNDMLDPMRKANFGDGVSRSNIVSQILQKVKGSQNVTFAQLERGSGYISSLGSADLEFIGEEVVDIPNSNITISIIGGI